ncbi:hypothetical protein E5336_11095 [Dubosiella muris]|uniref:Uncharacterized protein n=1 Tax=Dubosiella muris TaxID=3038133 RepID=A0AC61R572_9FIRM|nr:hypothetical protein E5336_11095 [Dubosiella muris]
MRMTTHTKKRTWIRWTSFLILCGLVVLGFGGMPVRAFDDGTQTVWDGYAPTTVMIDAGHGGMDSGAIAFNGQYEKDLSLEYALKIGAYIQMMDPSIAVLYTRTGDEVAWVDEETTMDFEVDDLVGRSTVVNTYAPDYLLCVHFNSAEDPTAYGYEAFVRPEDVASQQVYSLLSQKLANAGFSADLGLLSTADAPLHMVDLTNSASMLLELGFLTNEGDVYAINDPVMKENICRSIAEAYVETIHGAPMN